MATAIDDLLRLAWQAEWDGKPGLRDALLTLAVVDGGTENAVLAERCRRLLVARRPDHWFAVTPTLGQAIEAILLRPPPWAGSAPRFPRSGSSATCSARPFCAGRFTANGSR